MFTNLRARLGAFALSAALFGGASVASAQTVTDQTGGNYTNGFYITAGSNAGQSFTVPSGVQSIQAVSIGVGHVSSSTSVNVRLRSFTSPGVIGTSDIASATATTTASFSATNQVVLTIPGGRPVSPGEQYIILVEQVPAGSNATVTTTDLDYSGGTFFYAGAISANADSRFSVTYQDTVATPVPTLSEWAMILLGVTLAGGAALYIQRRRLIS